MTSLWNQINLPHKGWRCVAASDLRFEQGDNYTPEVCQMCGQENLRYVHVMEHDEYEPRLRVGCVCAEKMEGDYTNPKQRESKLANRLGRRGRWLQRNWRDIAERKHVSQRGRPQRRGLSRQVLAREDDPDRLARTKASGRLVRFLARLVYSRAVVHEFGYNPDSRERTSHEIVYRIRTSEH